MPSPDGSSKRSRLTAFVQALQDLGWTTGRNIKIEVRWTAAVPELVRRYSNELMAFAPSVVVTSGGSHVAALQEASRTVPTGRQETHLVERARLRAATRPAVTGVSALRVRHERHMTVSNLWRVILGCCLKAPAGHDF